MKSLLFFLLSLLLLGSCAPTSPQGATDPATVRALLPGTWVSSLSVDGVDLYMEKTFAADGTARGFIDMRGTSRGASFLLPRTPFRSRWKFDAEGHLVTYEVRTEVEGLFEKDFMTRDRILRASAERIDFIDVDSGERGRFVKKTTPTGPTSWSL